MLTIASTPVSDGVAHHLVGRNQNGWFLVERVVRPNGAIASEVCYANGFKTQRAAIKWAEMKFNL